MSQDLFYGRAFEKKDDLPKNHIQERKIRTAKKRESPDFEDKDFE